MIAARRPAPRSPLAPPSPTPRAPDLARHAVRLAAAAPDPDAVRAWAGHVAAGRIGAPAPEPAPAGGDVRLASLAAILGGRAAGPR